jgi:glutaredoxin-like protein NrdH
MKSMNIEYTEVDLSQNEEAYEMVRALGYTAAPVIISGNQHWSGFRMERIKSLVVNRG